MVALLLLHVFDTNRGPPKDCGRCRHTCRNPDRFLVNWVKMKVRTRGWLSLDPVTKRTVKAEGGVRNTDGRVSSFGNAVVIGAQPNGNIIA